MSRRSFFELRCHEVYWLVSDYRVYITRLSRRSFTWKALNKDGISVGRGKSTTAEGALRSAMQHLSSLKPTPTRKNWFSRLWHWLKGQQHNNLDKTVLD